MYWVSNLDFLVYLLPFAVNSDLTIFLKSRHVLSLYRLLAYCVLLHCTIYTLDIELEINRSIPLSSYGGLNKKLKKQGCHDDINWEDTYIGKKGKSRIRKSTVSLVMTYSYTAEKTKTKNRKSVGKCKNDSRQAC